MQPSPATARYSIGGGVVGGGSVDSGGAPVNARSVDRRVLMGVADDDDIDGSGVTAAVPAPVGATVRSTVGVSVTAVLAGRCCPTLARPRKPTTATTRIVTPTPRAARAAKLARW